MGPPKLGDKRQGCSSFAGCKNCPGALSCHVSSQIDPRPPYCEEAQAGLCGGVSSDTLSTERDTQSVPSCSSPHGPSSTYHQTANS